MKWNEFGIDIVYFLIGFLLTLVLGILIIKGIKYLFKL